MTSTDELVALQRTVRRLWAALAVVAVVAIASLGLTMQQRLSVPESIEVGSGTRAARLSPDGLVITLGGEQRAIIDAHSGVIVRDAEGHVAQLTGDHGVQRRGAPVGSGVRTQ